MEYELLTTGRKWNFKEGLAYPTQEDIKAVLKQMRKRLDEGAQFIEVGSIVMLREADSYSVYVKLGEITD